MKDEDYTTCRCAVLVDSGRDWTRTNAFTDVNPKDGNHDRNVTLLVVEPFNN
jgi:hypothetical protein